MAGNADISKWCVILGIVMMLLGILAIGSPFVAGATATLFIGGIVLVGGLVELVHAAFAEAWKSGVWKFLGGFLALLIGAFLLFRPIEGMMALTLILSIFFVMDGIFRIMLGLQARPASGSGWILFSGIVTLLLGGFIWVQWPVSGVWAIGLLIGIRILFAGWGMLLFGSILKTPAE